MKQVEMNVNFVVGDNLDPELFLEAMAAAMNDVLFDMPGDVQKANWDGVVESIEVNLIGAN